MHVLIGIYVWEWFSSLHFDWLYISGKRRWSYTIIPYFLNRYCLLFTFIGLAIALNVSTEINCQALYTFNQAMGNMCVGLAAMNLAIRCMAIWGYDNRVRFLLGAMILAHWVVLIDGVTLQASWVPGSGCVITNINTKLVLICYTLAMAIDFTTMILTLYRLVYAADSPKSELADRVLNDGGMYFAIACIVNAVAIVFIVLNLNPILAIIAEVPATTIATVAATRTIRHLANLSDHSSPNTLVGYCGTSMLFRANPQYEGGQSFAGVISSPLAMDEALGTDTIKLDSSPTR